MDAEATPPDESVDVPPESLDEKDVLQFWQREVQYYEGRAGEQGASAGRNAGASVAVIAALSVAANVLRDDAPPLLKLSLLVVPAVVLLLWGTTVRLWHEMSILRAYAEHAELQVARITRDHPTLSLYKPWKGIGSRYDMPIVITVVLGLMSIAIGVAGTVGVFWFLWPEFGWWFWLAVACFVLLAGGIAFTFSRQKPRARRVQETLGQPNPKPDPRPKNLRGWLRSKVW